MRGAYRRPRAPAKSSRAEWDALDDDPATEMLFAPDLEALVRKNGKFGLTVAGACRAFPGQPTSRVAPALIALVDQGVLSMSTEMRPPAARSVMVFRLAQKDLLS